MIRFRALYRSLLRMIPRFGAFAAVVGVATVAVGCVTEEVDSPVDSQVDSQVDSDADEELGEADQALIIRIRCRVCPAGDCEPGVFCNSDCFMDYCTAGEEYCDHEVGCLPYP